MLPAALLHTGALTHAAGVLQRKCGGCGQHTIAGGACSRCSEEREGSLQRAAQSRDSTNGHHGAVPPIVHEVLRSTGQPLETRTRGLMESRFAHDFSHVRVHTGAKAAESARAVNALAYTVGRDVVFSAGKYAPGTTAGKQLIAHELTHVVQQRGQTDTSIQALNIGPADGVGEQEADRMAQTLQHDQQVSAAPKISQSSSALGNRETLQRAPADHDPIHRPMLEEYRRSAGLPPGGIDERGQRVGPSDAQLKYGGLLAGFGTARWLAPVINRRNFAEVAFHAAGLSGTGGLTTQFINEREIHSSADVETAIPRPPVARRTDGAQSFCWFTQGLSANGRTTMDIFTPGPWDFVAPRSEVAAKYSWKPECASATGPATVHINARPNDAAMERFVRLGEAEHDADTQAAFNTNIAAYVANVNRHVGDTPAKRASGANAAACDANLAQMEDRNLLTQFAVDLNTATDRRHANGRHGIAHTGLTISPDCSRVVEEMGAGTL